MLTLSARVRIFAAVGPVDFRRGIDGLLAIVRDSFGDDAFSARRTRLRIRGWSEPATTA